jgi:small-conductance mechanosensitive channel
LKTTRLRNLSGEEVVLPNGELLKSRIHNWRRMSERRAVLRIGVVYGTPPETLREVPAALRRVIEGLGGVRFDRAHLVGLGASSIDFEAVYWILSPEMVDFLDRQQQVLLGVLAALAERGVALAYPTQTLIVSGQLQTADGVHPG